MAALNIADAFNSWFSIVGLWTAAWTDIPPGRLSGARDLGRFEVVTKDGKVGRSERTFNTYWTNKAGLYPEQVQGAFSRASRGEHLPQEYQLLIDADVAHLNGDLRRSVIDAGTATEFALAAHLGATLSANGLSREFVDSLILGANGLLGLFGLYKALADTSLSKNRIRTELAEVRNDAVHSNKAPTEDALLKALGWARKVVAEVNPLPTH